MLELIVAGGILLFTVVLFFFMQVADEYPKVEISAYDRRTLFGSIVMVIAVCGIVHLIAGLGV